MRQVPGEDHGEWVRRLRERARSDAEELVPDPPFGVFGLQAPRPRPAALAEAGQMNGVWSVITLVYGNWADPAGPLVTVASEPVRPDEPGLGTETELIRAIDHERNRLSDHAGVDDEEPPGPPEYRRAELSVGQAAVSGLVARHGNLWAARLKVGGVMVTVTGRGVDAGSVRLGPVTDLGPYLRGRDQMLGQVSERYRQRPAPVLAPAKGLAAVRALAETELESHTRLLAALRAGREQRHRAGEGPARRALWERAVREQARVWGTAERHADEAVTSMVNHLIHLQEQAPWFTGDPRLRQAAIDETLRHGVLGEDVDSNPAQQAWAHYWAQRTSLGAHPRGTALRAELRAGPPLLTAWLQAWTAWAGTQ